jgi:glycosyltransferase involved in cell wall biosynthesis
VRLALVTPWFGRELIGGAERHAWELSHALAAAGSAVDVLSTCCRSFNDDWSTNFHRAGGIQLGERLRLLRFRVDSRDRVAFGRVTAALTSLPAITLRGDHVPLDERDAEIFVGESIKSRALHAYLRENANEYDAVLFMPYLYGTTLAVLPAVAEKAFLIPCLHDEAYAYLEPVRSCFAQARGIMFNSPGEEETAAAIYGPGIYAKSRVVGEAVEPVPPPREPMRIGSFAPNRSRYVLYLGRQVATKNIDFLIAAFRLFRERRAATSLQLVLAGPTNSSRGEDGIIDLGPVNEDAKPSLLTYARALAQPSTHESFSRAVHESWYAGRPVLVHGRCRATARAVEDSGGGWIGSTLDDWARMFAELDESSDDAVDAVGRRGWAAAADSGNWEVVAARALAAIEAGLRRPRTSRIDQVVPLGDRAAAAYADAVGAALRDAGCDAVTVIAESASFRAGAHRLVHAGGVGVPLAGGAYVAHDAQPDFPPSARVFAVSRDVAAGLDERGIVARIVPQPVSPAPWDGVRPAHAAWTDGRPVLLSIAPLGAADARRLLDVFVAFLGMSGAARLLIFTSDCADDAVRVLTQERAELDLANEVVLVGDAIAERYAAYRAASVALAAGLPLDVVRAMTPLWFDVPILALGDPGAVDPVEAAAIIECHDDARRFAALVRLVIADDSLRDALRAEQRRARERHAPRASAATILEAFQEPRTELSPSVPSAS